MPGEGEEKALSKPDEYYWAYRVRYVDLGKQVFNTSSFDERFKKRFEKWCRNNGGAVHERRYPELGFFHDMETIGAGWGWKTSTKTEYFGQACVDKSGNIYAAYRASYNPKNYYTRNKGTIRFYTSDQIAKVREEADHIEKGRIAKAEAERVRNETRMKLRDACLAKVTRTLHTDPRPGFGVGIRTGYGTVYGMIIEVKPPLVLVQVPGPSFPKWLVQLSPRR